MSPGRTVAVQQVSSEELASRVVERRAVEAVLWGMPAVNFDLMYQAFLGVKGGPNQVVYWSRPVDWKNQTLTPNPDTIYFMPFYDTRKGPVVLEIPPADDGSITGSIDDGWQNALEDVGPAGADKGKGGKYLILPPGYAERVPGGHIALQSDTYRGFALLRSNLKSGSDADIVKAVAYGRRMNFYPVSDAGGVRTKFVDALGQLFDSTIPYDLRFFEALHRFVQIEPWLTRDKALIQTLQSIGIRKGKPFAPDEETKSILADAARQAHAEIDAQYETVFVPPFYDGTHWALPGSKEVVDGLQNFFSDPNSYAIDGRAVMYSFGFFSAKHFGTGQSYLMTIKDATGRRLEGDSSYRLSVPANPPVKLYWSVTVYDGETHALIRSARWSSRSSNTPDLTKNADGSVDVFFGPKPPPSGESNWIPTTAGRRFEVLARFYGPEKSFSEKKWRLTDIELAK